jgi:putative ATPase
MNAPLAERLRPQHFSDLIGQEKLVGPQGALGALLRKGVFPSMIFWGPPGVGKTTLAQIIAKESGRKFHTLSAINSGVKDVREVINQAQSQGLFNEGKAPVLFIDEIHRFSKSQQDSLLGAVERGIVSLIGATTENPSFEVIPALRSRCQIYILEPLNKEALEQILNRALEKDQWLRDQALIFEEKEALFRYSGGDARKFLNNLELVASQSDRGSVITNKGVENILRSAGASYDKNGEQHYDIISAFIKSVRGSDPNAALYWLARMIQGGEEPRFIARRLLILASEDIGLANPNALLLANATFDALDKIGWPEGRIILSQCTVYLANSPKSNTSYKAINRAMALAEEMGDLPVPLHLRNAPTQLMKELGYGKEYQYSHDQPNNFGEQEFMPEELKGTVLFEPGQSSTEKKTSELLRARWPKYYS